jgi:hypothetical protein
VVAAYIISVTASKTIFKFHSLKWIDHNRQLSYPYKFIIHNHSVVGG